MHAMDQMLHETFESAYVENHCAIRSPRSRPVHSCTTEQSVQECVYVVDVWYYFHFIVTLARHYCTHKQPLFCLLFSRSRYYIIGHYIIHSREHRICNENGIGVLDSLDMVLSESTKYVCNKRRRKHDTFCIQSFRTPSLLVIKQECSEIEALLLRSFCNWSLILQFSS